MVDLSCPFCNENDFDMVGLKKHILYDCEAFSKVENIKEKVKVVYEKEGKQC